MKTTILTFIAAITLTIGTTAFASAATTTNGAIALTSITAISKIEAHGNVEVYITNGTKDGVKVYDENYYAKGTLVQEQNGVLRITNYNKNEKLLVEVTVTQLQKVAAYDNAVIKSDKLALVDLQVDLYNQAYAGLKLDSYAANINVNDQAKADLSGDVTEYNLTYSYSATVNQSELAAVNTSEVRKTAPVRHAANKMFKTMASI